MPGSVPESEGKSKRRRPIAKRKITLGMKVTCLVREAAYGSGRNGAPEVFFEPGMVGTVGAVDTPCVTYAYRDIGGTATFVCVDFEGPEHGKTTTWRVGLFYNNIKIVK